MTNLILGILKEALGVLKPLVLPILSYFQGRKSAFSKATEETLKEHLKNEKIEESNRIKSDVDILNELRDRDRRG